MKKINLLFRNNKNYENWDNYKSDWEHTLIDLNISEIITFFEKSNIDFQSQYLLKPCLNISDANYRLDIMEEILNNNDLFEQLKNFSTRIKTLNEERIEYYEEKNAMQKQYRFLRIVCEYFSCIFEMITELTEVKSQGLKSLYNYCKDISINEEFIQFSNEATNILLEIENMLINNILIIEPINKMFSFEKGNIDLNESEQLKSIILKIFDLDINNEYSVVDPAPFSNMEEKILEELKQNNAKVFHNLNTFYEHSIIILEDINSYSNLYKQMQFYISYVNFLKSAINNGISICKPQFDEQMYYADECFSPSLITKRMENNKSLDSVIANNIRLPKGKMFLLSGPNQGGKTFYLKSVGQTAYLAKCGCFVLAKTCIVPFYDNICTHFMQTEVLGKGRLIEEIERIELSLLKITSNTLMLLNESFTSTRRKDGVQISLHYIKKFNESGCTVGFVSHYYEIPELYKNSDMIIPLSCGIDNKGKRTYKVSETLGTGLAYAKDIAYKCGMTIEQILAIIKENKNEKN